MTTREARLAVDRAKGVLTDVVIALMDAEEEKNHEDMTRDDIHLINAIAAIKAAIFNLSAFDFSIRHATALLDKEAKP